MISCSRCSEKLYDNYSIDPVIAKEVKEYIKKRNRISAEEDQQNWPDLYIGTWFNGSFKIRLWKTEKDNIYYYVDDDGKAIDRPVYRIYLPPSLFILLKLCPLL